MIILNVVRLSTNDSSGCIRRRRSIVGLEHIDTKTIDIVKKNEILFKNFLKLKIISLSLHISSIAFLLATNSIFTKS